ncbi:MAG: UDP-glucose/iron transport system ATP-binding protein [Acidimicrobiaceae bacterium]|nr:UDP-glucose/iron transport system ATP-binding protein [Acidimicrobiaceae bacterium]
MRPRSGTGRGCSPSPSAGGRGSGGWAQSAPDVAKHGAVTVRFEFRDVRVDGDDGPIVKGFFAVVPAEGLTAIVGPSGAGKTTLLRLLNRLDDPDEGVVLFEGRDVRDYDVLELRRRVQSVGQVPVTFPGTVRDNVGADTPALLERVGLNPALASREADRLSVGEAQRMALARSLALRPDVLALDEPTSALDTSSKGGIERLIRELADSGLTVVMVTHDPRQAELADQVVEVRPLPRPEPGIDDR